jgi:hypothetical protein
VRGRARGWEWKSTGACRHAFAICAQAFSLASERERGIKC